MPTPASDRPRAPGASWAARAALLVVSTALSVGAAELVVRAGGWAPQIQVIEITGGAYRMTEDPDLPYEPVPGRGQFNRYGMRDRARAVAPLDSGHRVVAIGDSVLFGGGSPVPKIFTSRLEDALRTHDPRLADAEVWNLGVPGYDTVNEVALLQRRALGLKPGLVLVGYCLNDRQVQSTELQRLTRHPKHREQKKLRELLARNAMARSELVRLVLYRLAEDEPADTPPPPPYTNVELGFARLKALADEHGFDVAVVVFPFLEPYSRYAHEEAHARVAAIAARHGFPVLDLLPAFRQRFGDDVASIRVHRHDRLHLNALAHDHAARTATPFVARQLLSRAARP